jgi:hypothetical protein
MTGEPFSRLWTLAAPCLPSVLVFCRSSPFGAGAVGAWLTWALRHPPAPRGATPARGCGFRGQAVRRQRRATPRQGRGAAPRCLGLLAVPCPVAVRPPRRPGGKSTHRRGIVAGPAARAEGGSRIRCELPGRGCTFPPGARARRGAVAAGCVARTVLQAGGGGGEGRRGRRHTRCCGLQPRTVPAGGRPAPRAADLNRSLGATSNPHPGLIPGRRPES